MAPEQRHPGAGRRVDLGLGGRGTPPARPARRGGPWRRRLGISIGGFWGGALVLMLIGLVAGMPGYAVGQMGLAGAGSGLLLGLSIAGAVEDGEVQRASDHARGVRSGPADR